ncbi:uncharacterized protein LOC133814188 [Humulus lupulus]|uniref:uncharacterized protein LOC133814188 n=1 Tax=Humulus lupulus TaxID=3486 RepID=UPI002B401CA1|nr:uncharacterized protein LOC133814188 [Humulus lupulus]
MRFHITFVYGLNDEMGRGHLWQEIMGLASNIDEAWMILGYFNEILHYEERAEDRVYSKLDRAVVNPNWSDAFPNSKVVFLPEGSFDDCPILVSFYQEICNGHKRFWYYRMWRDAKNFSMLVKTSWDEAISAELQAKQSMLECQATLQQDPMNGILIDKEKEARGNYIQLNKAYCLFLAQKAKTNWVNFGDENNTFFHASLKIRRAQNKINSIKNERGLWVDKSEDVKVAFMDYYQELLGTTMPNQLTVTKAIVPGPDGYGSFFFQDNWDLISLEVSDAVLSFLKTGKLLKEVNTTTITLIPKSKCPDNLGDFRPIACCNVIYMAATKLICSRLRMILPDLVAKNQGGFVHGRYIAYNIMVCQDLVRHYGRKSSKQSCTIKIDLRKAYDTVEWDFIGEMLTAFK